MRPCRHMHGTKVKPGVMRGTRAGFMQIEDANLGENADGLLVSDQPEFDSILETCAAIEGKVNELA